MLAAARHVARLHQVDLFWAVALTDGMGQGFIVVAARLHGKHRLARRLVQQGIDQIPQSPYLGLLDAKRRGLASRLP